MSVTPTVTPIGTSVDTLNLAAGSVGGVAIALTIDPVVDYLLIYTNSGTATQGISRNTLLGLASQPLGLTDTQSPTNKTFNNTNTITLKDTLFTLQDDGDTTKQAKFQLSGITTGTTRTYTLPNASGTLMDTSTAQTATNKTFTNPTINSPTITNATISADTVSGFTVSNNGSIYGISVAAGIITSTAVGANAIAMGALSPTKTALPYKFSAYRNAAQNGGNNAFAVVNFDTKVYDTGSNFDIITNVGRFTAPVNGFYWFSWHQGFASGSSDCATALYKNGVELIRGSRLKGSASIVASTGSDLVQAVAGDYFEIYSFSNTQLALNVGSAIDSGFMGYLVSAT